MDSNVHVWPVTKTWKACCLQYSVLMKSYVNPVLVPQVLPFCMSIFFLRKIIQTFLILLPIALEAFCKSAEVLLVVLQNDVYQQPERAKMRQTIMNHYEIGSN